MHLSMVFHVISNHLLLISIKTDICAQTFLAINLIFEIANPIWTCMLIEKREISWLIKFVDLSKSWKHLQFFSGSQDCQIIKFLRLTYSQLHYLITLPSRTDVTSRQLVFWEFSTHNSVVSATTFIKNGPSNHHAYSKHYVY